MQKFFKIIGLAVFAIVFLAILISVIPGGEEKLNDSKEGLEQKNAEIQEKIESKKESVLDKSPAFQLAALESTNHTNPPQELITDFDLLLKSLNEKCSEDDESRLSDFIVFSKQKLDEKGLSYSYLEVAEGVNNSIPAESQEDVSCQEVAAAFIVMTDE